MAKKIKLYIVVKNFTEHADDFEQLQTLVNEKDDKDGKVVGTKDGTVEIIPLREADWLKEKETIEGKVLFIGDIKDIKAEKSDVVYVFEKHGVKYGWSGSKYAFIDINENAVSKQPAYYEFLSEFSFLPVCKEELKDGWEAGLHPGKLPDRKGGLHPIQTFVVPFGFIKTIKDNHDDKETVRKQLYTYGIINFYYNDLQKFLDFK